VAFNPDNVRDGAPPRFSAETRSVVVTKDKEHAVDLMGESHYQRHEIWDWDLVQHWWQCLLRMM